MRLKSKSPRNDGPLNFSRCLIGFGVVLAMGSGSARAAQDADVAAFTDRYCSSCHNDVDKEGGLDLTSFDFKPSDPANFTEWVKVHDRVQNGEMPPKEKK